MGSGVAEVAVQVSLGTVLLHVTLFSTTVTCTVGVAVFPCSCGEVVLIALTIVVAVSLVLLGMLVTAAGTALGWSCSHCTL